MLDLITDLIREVLPLLNPPNIGTKVQFHHPHLGWTWGIIRKIAMDAEDLEDVPHWGAWIAHPLLGRVWCLGAEIIGENNRKQRAHRHI